MRSNKFIAAITRAASVVLAVLTIFALLSFAACRNNNGNNAKGFPNDAQRANIVAIAEAFCESGLEYNEENALGFAQMESFVYYLYNGELTDEGNGYATVRASEVDERLLAYFGMAPVLRTTRRTGSIQKYFYKDNFYYVLVNRPAFESGGIKSVNKNENGTYTVSVSLTNSAGVETVLEMVFSVDGDNTKVMSVKRFDGA